MKIEVGDKLWFGDKGEGVTDSVVVEHILLDEELCSKIKEYLKDESIDNLDKVDGLILLKPSYRKK